MTDIKRITPGSKADLARRMAARRRELIARPLAEIWEELAAVAMDGSDPAPPSGLPEAWQCTDALHPYLLGHITQNRDTIKAWESGGIEYVALVPASRSRSAASTVEPVAWQYRYRLSNDWRNVGPTKIEQYRSAYREEIERGDVLLRPLYAAPTTSPEPRKLTSDEARRLKQAAVVSGALSYEIDPELAAKLNASPEPDAVRVEISDEDMRDLLASKDVGSGRAKLRRLLSLKSTAALSRPAHGDVKAPICVKCGKPAIGDCEAIPRNHRVTSQPITDGDAK